MEIEAVVCGSCAKVFKRRKSLYEHLRHVHKTEPDLKGTLACPWLGCKANFLKHSGLVHHLTTKHRAKIEKDEFKFKSRAEFDAWKEGLETTTHTSYYIRNSNTASNGAKRSTFICHRSGTYISKSLGLRAVKKKGSCRSGFHCPSRIELFEGDKITVVYFKTHIGHRPELQHISIRPEEREYLAKKLADGVSLDKCLNEVQADSSNERFHLLTRKDLWNILNSCSKSEDQNDMDLDSIQPFIDEALQLAEFSPVLLYKPQGIAHENLTEDDFMLVVMTPTQKDIFLKFCDNTICVDTIQGPNAHDFYLTTLIVIDEFSVGFPSAFCISNNMGVNQMGMFFECIRENAKYVTPQMFISGEAMIYRNAWLTVMGDANTHILSPWQVDQSWRKELGKVNDRELRVSIYRYLKALLKETNQDNFKDLLTKFIVEISADDIIKDFFLHFESNYLNRCEEWAYCCQLPTTMSTNRSFEAVHKALKQVYMQGKISKRLDKYVSHLLQFAKDRVQGRCAKLIKATSVLDVAEVHDRHCSGLKISQENIKKISDCDWIVKSAENENVKYDVRKSDDEAHKCQLMCTLCFACLHSYSCACADNMVGAQICEHIHAVHVSTTVNLSSSTNEVVLNKIESCDGFDIQSEIQESNDEDFAIPSKLDLVHNLLDQKLLTSDNEDQINRHLNVIIGILNNCESTSKVENGPANKKLKL